MNDTPVLALARRLIACASVTPEEGGTIGIIFERLAPLGFDCCMINRNNVSNLWARRGQAAPLFMFAGHVDVVPPGPLTQWSSPPFEPEVRGEYMYGRGAADMKSSIAAFVCALEDFIGENPGHAGSLALLITSDEEGDAVDGSAAVVEALKARQVHCDYCVIGEPTSVDRLGDTIKNGRRGSLSGKLIVQGVQGHIAYPHLARNPIHLAAPAIAELAAIQWDEGGKYFPPTSWQISNVNGGTGATNIIPGSVEFTFNFRFSTASTPQSLKAQLEAVLRRHDLEYELIWNERIGNPYLTPPGRLVDAASAAITEVLEVQAEVSTTGGTSDGRFICEICRELLEIGPVNTTSHKIDECVRVADLPRLQALYLNLIQRMLVSP